MPCPFSGRSDAVVVFAATALVRVVVAVVVVVGVDNRVLCVSHLRYFHTKNWVNSKLRETDTATERERERARASKESAHKVQKLYALWLRC